MKTIHSNRRVPQILLGVAFSVAAAVPTVGAASAGPVRLDLGSGIFAKGGRVSVKEHGRRRRIDSSAGPALALTLGYAVSEYVDAVASGEVATTAGIFDGTSYAALNAGARVYPLGRGLRVRPWLIGEAGWIHADATHRSLGLFGSPSHTHHWQDDGGNLQFGGGFDIPIGTHFSLGPDVRYHRTVGVFNDPGYVSAMLNLSFHIGHTDPDARTFEHK